MPKKRETKGGYVTRTQAVRYLQVSLADFRRLCILKGIYPRDLSGRAKRKIQKGSTKPLTAYYRKDIQYLAHEPILNKFRAHKTFAKKLSRAIGRGDVSDAKRLDANRPRYTLDHIIKERYPTFIDALGDLDDALSMLFLFAQMPATDKVSHRITEDAERLTTEWTAYIARNHLLKHVFVSIKGIYYQAVVKGQEVTWVVPHKFPQSIPSDIDFRIMLTFLEFYTTLCHFVLFKLYTEANLVYPPQINKKRENGVGGIGSFILETRDQKVLPDALTTADGSNPDSNSGKSKSKADVEIKMDKVLEANKADIEEDEEEDAEEEDDNEVELDQFKEVEGGDTLLQPAKTNSDLLFSKFTFFIGREVPLDLVEFVILAHGGKVISEAAIDELIDNEDPNKPNDTSAIKLNLQTVTHQICDRPSVLNKIVGRVYVQPQWLLDSVNQTKLLSTAEYAPGNTLPPHLSPWGDRGTYNPEEEESDSEPEVEGAENEADGEPQDLSEDEEEEEEEEDKEEEKMKAKPSKRQKKDKEAKKRNAELDLRKTMMSKKQRTLYDKIQGGIDKQQERQDTLRQKRKQLK